MARAHNLAMCALSTLTLEKQTWIKVMPALDHGQIYLSTVNGA